MGARVDTSRIKEHLDRRSVETLRDVPVPPSDASAQRTLGVARELFDLVADVLEQGQRLEPESFRRRFTKLRPALKGGGGTAYDAARQAIWVTDGLRVLLKDLSSGAESCQFNATVAKGARVTGFAHSNRRSELIQLEELATSTGSTAPRLRWSHSRRVAPSPRGLR